MDNNFKNKYILKTYFENIFIYEEIFYLNKIK